MYRPRVFRQMLAVLLATIVVALVSVREVHYLFTEHGGQHEHCHNHLHAADAHFHCEVCKADIASFTDEVQPPALVSNQTYVQFPCKPLVQPVYTAQQHVAFLRGPPSKV